MVMNKIYYLHHHVSVVVSLLLGMNTISSSSALSELVSNNKRMVNTECIETERYVLLDIKRGLAGGTSSNLSYDSSQAQKNCCEWSAVGCDHNTGHVTHLNLYQHHTFYTKFPNSVSALNISSLLYSRYLKYLDLGIQFQIII